MTDRKPPGVSWESWIERLIQDARDAGAFDELPGAGRPMSDLERPHDEDWWLKAKLRREDLSWVPPTISIRADRDATLDAALRAPTEEDVRTLVEELNTRIGAVNRMGAVGPPSTVAKLDVDCIVERWRARRPTIDVEAADTEPPADDDLTAPRRRRWLPRRRSA